MKRFLLSLVVISLVIFAGNAQTTYTWNNASGSWTTAANWTPTRTTPLTNDILVFDGSLQANPTVTDVPTESIGGLQFINNVSVTLSTTAINTVSIGDASVSSPQFSVASGSALSVSGASALTLSITTTFTGDVYGSISYGAAAHKLLSTDASSLHFKNGATFTANTGFSSSAFGATNLNSVIFESGSSYILKAGSNPFGATAPNSVVNFQSGSLYSHQSTTLPSLSGRSYANFEMNISTFNNSMTGANPFRCDTFSITSVNTANFNLTGGIIISGDLKVLSGTVTFNPLSSNTILFDGSVKQDISGSFSLNSSTQISIANVSYVNLLSSFSIPGSVIVYGKLYTNSQTVSGAYFGLHPSAGASLTTGDLTNNSNTIDNVTGAANFLPGTPISGTGIPSGAYVLNGYGTTLKISRFATLNSTGVTLTPGTSIGTLGIGSASGITSSLALGNIQTTTRLFPNDANYIYNGTITQVTGDGLPASITGTLQVNNTSAPPSSGVTLSQATTVSGTYEIVNGNTTLGANNFTINSITQTGTASLTNNHIVTDDVGYLTIKSVGTGPIDFPVGPSSDSLNTLTISNGGGVDYSLRIDKGIVPSIAFPTYGINRTWDLKASAANSGVTLKFQFYTTDANAGVSPTGLLEILLNTDLGTPGPWNIIPLNYNINATGSNPWWVTSVTTLSIASSAFSAYAIGKNGYAILPADCIISTRAQKRNNTGIISWSVNSCSDVISFEVQRSVNNSGFSTIGTVDPAANQTDFSFTDGSLAGGTNLYRIKVNRLSGATKYSNTVALLYNSNDILITSLVPNPVHSSAVITVSTARSAMVDFKVFDMSGHVVKQWQSNIAEGNNTININVDGLAAGVYHILAGSNDAKAFSRFIKQ